MINPSHLGNVEFVSSLARLMKKNKVAFNEKTYHLLIQTYAKRRDTENVIQILNEMKNGTIKPDAKIYETVVNLLAFTKKSNQAFDYLKESTNENIICNYSAFKATVCAYIEQNNLAKANEVLQLAKNVQLQGIKHLYDDIIHAYACREDIKTIRKLIDEMQHSGIYVRPFVLDMLKQYEAGDGSFASPITQKE